MAMCKASSAAFAGMMIWVISRIASSAACGVKLNNGIALTALMRRGGAELKLNFPLLAVRKRQFPLRTLTYESSA